METLKTGALAYYDGLRGPIKGKVTAIIANDIAGPMVAFQITARDSIWRRGEIIHTPARHVFPRKSLSRRTAKMGRILPYRVECD